MRLKIYSSQSSVFLLGLLLGCVTALGMTAMVCATAETFNPAAFFEVEKAKIEYTDAINQAINRALRQSQSGPIQPGVR